MAKNHTLFHKIKSVVGYSIATVVIIIALAVSGLRFILTSANLYQKEVEELASSLLEQPVKIGSMDAKLSGLVPTLIFHNVQLISDKTKKSLFELSRIDVGISFDSLLFQQEIIPTQLTIRGMDLKITRKVDGSFKIKGLDLEGLTASAEIDKSNILLERLLSQKNEIGLEDSTLIWKDEQNAGLTWFFGNVNFLLKNSGGRHQFSLSSDLPNVLGKKIKLAFDFEGDINKPELWKVKSFIESKGFNLAPLQYYIRNRYLNFTSGTVDLKLWGNLENNIAKQFSGDVKLYNISYETNKIKNTKLKFVSGVFDLQNNKINTWNFSVKHFIYSSGQKYWPETKFSLAFEQGNSSNKKFHVSADYLNLDELSQIIKDNNLMNLKKMENFNIEGDIYNLYASWQEDKIQQLKANFKDLGINPSKKSPYVKGLSGNIEINKQQGNIFLLSKNTTIAFPSLFRAPFKFNEFSSDINFWTKADGLLFDVNHLSTGNPEVTAISKAKLWIPKNKTSPHLDLHTYVSKGNISKISHFLPVGIMADSLVKWIDEGILHGSVNEGTILFSGKLNEFPFNKKEGVFAVDVATSNVDINYQDNWPKITSADITGYFTGQGMKLSLQEGDVENNKIYNSQAEIPSFTKAELGLDIKTSGSAHNTAQYLVNSPILPQAKQTINSMRFLGDINTDVKINIPLSSTEESISYTGTSEFINNSLFMLEDKIDVSNISGIVKFTEKGLSSENIVANIIGERASLSVRTLEKNNDVKVSAKGKLNSGLILKRFDIPGANKVRGLTSYSGNIIFPSENRKTRKKRYPVLRLKSNLYGVKSNLPDLFYKNEKKRQQFKFKTIFTENNKTQFGLEFGKKISAALELDQSGEAVYLNRGAISASRNKAVLPKKNILYVDGSVSKLTPSKWIKALELDKSKKKQTFFVKPVVLNLDKLNIFTEAKGNNNTTVSNPRHLPPIEGIINSFSYDEIFLGRLDFKTSIKKYGMHLDEMILSARNMKLFASGDWKYKRKRHNTKLDLTLSSNDFGGMLNDLGFAAIIDKGIAKTVGKIFWSGAPTQFALAKLNGNIQLNIEDGSVKEVDAGAGRLLGFFSLSALPRKLFGDFKGVFKEGFSFDEAQGEIKIENGDAYTDDFAITSTVADISVSGRTGLEAQDYENTVEVVPEVGGGIAGITALLVNLPAGIGMWLIDKITGEQFNEASTRTYEIEGTWDDPIIELIENE